MRFRSLPRQPAYKAVSSVMEQHILSGELKPARRCRPSRTSPLSSASTVRRSVIDCVLEQEGCSSATRGAACSVLPGLFDLASRSAFVDPAPGHVRELWEVAIARARGRALAAQRADETDLREIDDNLAATAETVAAARGRAHPAPWEPMRSMR
jgi:hypothetical protein